MGKIGALFNTEHFLNNVREVIMDRRQKKTRDAIFKAFTELVSEKNYNQISVQEIIDGANIGRTTFYAHFETKDFLLKELCEELFDHIIDTAMGLPHGHRHAYCDNEADSVFLHLFRHLQKNDNNILTLLAGQNNNLFLRYFEEGLQKLIQSQLDLFAGSFTRFGHRNFFRSSSFCVLFDRNFFDRNFFDRNFFSRSFFRLAHRKTVEVFRNQ